MHPTVSIHHALTDLLQSTFFNISQTCFVSSTHFLVHASCSERQMCCLFITWCEWQDFHQFLAPVVRKQFSTRQQANPLGLHCLEEAQCVSGVLPSLFCKYTTVLKETQYGLDCRWSRTVSLAGSGAGQREETGDCKPPSCAGDVRLEQSHPGPSSYTETHI